MTFKTARSAMLTQLQALGWTVKPDLKVAHATSPDGEIRLWFKAQAVYFTVQSRPWCHEFANARALSYDLDIRTARVADVVKLAEIRAGRPQRAHGETGHVG